MADIMARGEAWLSTIGWEAVPAFPVAAEADLRYTHPAPGDFTFVDSYCIPAEAPNLDTAYAFINHMLSPEAQAIAMDDMDSATVNEKAIPLLDDATRELFPYDNLDEIFKIAPVWGLPTARGPGRRHRDLQRMARGMGTRTRRPSPLRIRRQRRRHCRRRDHQALRRHDRPRRRLAAGRAGDLRLPARPQRLRQDDAAAHHRRLRAARRRQRHHPRPASRPAAAEPARRSTPSSSGTPSFRT